MAPGWIFFVALLAAAMVAAFMVNQEGGPTAQ